MKIIFYSFEQLLNNVDIIMKKVVIIIFFLCSGCNNSNHTKSSEKSLLTIRSEKRIKKLFMNNS